MFINYITKSAEGGGKPHYNKPDQAPSIVLQPVYDIFGRGEPNS